ncbi:MAG: helix-turn-helix domain-containing protein [Gemmatimonadetes bacterium]|nr:helix-turn-helix domain-containing protein [Gemmatimonadota bacterium]
MSDVLSVAEAAKHCPTFSEVTLRRLARAGELPVVRHGRRLFFTAASLRDRLGPLFQG